MANTGQYGGQCVVYVRNYFGQAGGITYAKDFWNSSRIRRLSGPKSGCIAVWGATSSNPAGHVGVVESYDAGTGNMRFSDSNRSPAWKELVYVYNSISAASLQGLCRNFLGYAEYI